MLWVPKPNLRFPVANYCQVHSGDFYNFFLGTDYGFQQIVKSPAVD